MPTPAPSPFDPRWPVALGLSMGTAVSNSLSRFAYGLILPAMRTDLGWSYTQAGWINTANAIGYLIGALAALVLVGRIGPKKLFVGGMALMAGTLLLSSLTRDFALLTALRIVTGLGGGPAFVAGAALVSGLFRGDAKRTALAIAIYMGGAGAGMLASGATLPFLFEARGASAWPPAWALLGCLALAATLASLPAVRRAQAPPPRSGAQAAERLPARAMAFELAGYGLYGLGYIVYVTFLVAWMHEAGFGPVLVALTWSVVGVGIMLSPILWSPILARSKGGGALALANSATGLGTLLPLLVPGAVGVLLSGAVFGLSIFNGAAAVTAFGRANLPEAQWGRSVALFTCVFAVGQILGPVAAGRIADGAHGLSAGLLAAAATLFAAAAVAYFQRPLAR